MKKIKEAELKQEIERFNNKKVIIKYTGLVNAIIYIEKININFDYRTGFLYMKDIIHKNRFKVNIAPAYNIQIEEDNSELLIQLDNGIDINIKIKKWVDLFLLFYYSSRLFNPYSIIWFITELKLILFFSAKAFIFIITKL